MRAAVAAQLANEKNFSDSARAQIALLNQQMDELRRQMASLGKALDASEQADKAKDLQIANLGQRLNVALASKVEELQRYRSEFFSAGCATCWPIGPALILWATALWCSRARCYSRWRAPISAALAPDQIRDIAATL